MIHELFSLSQIYVYIMVHALMVVTVVVLVQNKLFVPTEESKSNHGNAKPGKSVLESVDPSELTFVTPRVSSWLVSDSAFSFIRDYERS